MPSAFAKDRGFRMGQAGLLVPNSLEHARTRYVLTEAQGKLLKRTIVHVFGPAELAVQFKCATLGCPDPRIEQRPTPGGGFVLRCGCRDRVFQPQLARPTGGIYLGRR